MTVPAPRKRVSRRIARTRPEARPAPAALVALWSELKQLGQRSSETLIGAYVAAARSVLGELERLEDLGAERRYRQRTAQAARAQKNQAQKKPLPPVEGA